MPYGLGLSGGPNASSVLIVVTVVSLTGKLSMVHLDTSSC